MFRSLTTNGVSTWEPSEAIRPVRAANAEPKIDATLTFNLFFPLPNFSMLLSLALPKLLNLILKTSNDRFDGQDRLILLKLAKWGAQVDDPKPAFFKRGVEQSIDLH
jgi:hypothetical protein